MSFSFVKSLRQQQGFIGDSRSRNLLLFNNSLLPVVEFNFAADQSLKSRRGGVTATLTRATAKTYFNSAGSIATVASGAAAFGYNPLSLSPLGCSIEEARTTYMRASDLTAYAVDTTQPAAFIGASGTNPTVSNELPALYGDRLLKHQYTGSGDTNVAAQGTGVMTGFPAASAVCSSCWVWVPSAYSGTIQMTLEGNVGANSAPTGYNQSYDSTKRDQWQQIAVTATLTAGQTATAAVLRASGTAAFYSCCWQSEASDFPTSFIPNASATLTAARNADVINLLCAPWFNPVQGTMFVEGMVDYRQATPGYPRLFSFAPAASKDTNEISVYWRTSDGVLSGAVAVDASNTDTGPGIAVTIGVPFKVAFRYGVGDTSLVVNGSVASKAAPAALPTGIDTCYLGDAVRFQTIGRKFLNRAAYFPYKLPVSLMQRMTLP